MKTKLILLAAALILLPGCVSGAKMVTAMAKDPATSHIRVSTVWGVFEYSRTVPTTNEIHRVFNAPLAPTLFPAFTP